MAASASSVGLDAYVLAAECVHMLLEQQLFDQADTLASYALALAAGVSGDQAHDAKADTLLMRADAIAGKGEHKRALHFYRQAQLLLKLGAPPGSRGGHAPSTPGTGHVRGVQGGLGQTATPTTPLATRAGAQLANQATPKPGLHTGGGGATPLVPPVPSALSINSDVQMRLKVAQCCVELKEYRAALVELDAIPPKQRSLRVHLLLGQLNLRIGHPRGATAALRECVRQCPCLLEAIASLVKLGASVKDIAQLLPAEATTSACGRGAVSGGGGIHAMSAGEVRLSCKWLLKYAEACACREAHKFQVASEQWRVLAGALGGQQPPPSLLLDMAQADAAQGRYDEAMRALNKARTADPLMLEGADDVALLMLLHGARGESKPQGLLAAREPAELQNCGLSPVDEAELGRLTAEVMALGPVRKEALLVGGAFWASRGDLERALVHVEQVLEAEEGNFNALLLKAWLLLQGEEPNPAAAASSFRRAFLSRPELRAAQGLCRCCVRISRWKEAVGAAREAVKAYPESASAQALLGEVHLLVPESGDRARKVLEAAMKLRPRSLAAVLGLAEWQVKEGQFQAAAELLQGQLEESLCPFLAAGGGGTAVKELLHVRLGFTHLLAKNYMEASSHFRAAIQVNPRSVEAAQGLQRLDELLKAGEQDAVEYPAFPATDVSPFLM